MKNAVEVKAQKWSEALGSDFINDLCGDIAEEPQAKVELQVKSKYF